MGTEAQKLISVSLEKMANFRRRRREMSLHKNLLVTTVIHKARIAIMEETYYLMTSSYSSTKCLANDCGNPGAATAEPDPSYYERPPTPMYGNPANTVPHPHYADQSHPHSASVTDLSPVATSERTMAESMDWEAGELTDEDEDKENLSPCCGEQSHNRLPCRQDDSIYGTPRGYKRHRPIGDDVDASLPKRVKWESTVEIVPSETNEHQGLSLVSVLSASLSAASMLSAPQVQCPAVRLVRSVSTPDLCSQQAVKDEMGMGMGGRPLAIAV